MKRMPRPFAVVLCFALCAAWVAWGCGPWYPADYLVSGNEQRVLAMPEGRFDYELIRALGVPKDHFKQPKYSIADKEANSTQWDSTLSSDLADLQEALDELNLPKDRQSALLRDYEALRRTMKRATDGTEDDITFGERERRLPTSWTFDLTPYQPLLAVLPAEFALYLRGAAAYRANQATSATAHWTTLLALPAEQRQYRSTWAAFMLGKAMLLIDPAKAIPFFEQTRALAADDFSDTLDLARESWGWQARAERKSGHPIEALHHYTESVRTPDPKNYNLALSFRLVCNDIMTSLPAHTPIFQDAPARRIMSAWIATRAKPDQVEKWKQALAKSGAKLEPTETDQLAWVAYRAGKIDEATQWIARSRNHTPVGSWVQAKLLLRRGKIDEGLKLLKSLVPLLPQDEGWISQESLDYTTAPQEDIQAEIGVLLLGREDYFSALDTFFRSDYYMQDAIYIAERVLSTKELEAYLKLHQNDPLLLEKKTGYYTKSLYDTLRYLLARRLARAQQWERARGFYPNHMLGTFDDYVEALKAGRDTSKTPRQRAEFLFKAGMITRKYGLRLLGTEGGPDMMWLAGLYPGASGHTNRLKNKTNTLPVGMRQPTLVKALSASADEKDRLRAHPVEPDQRWHYRYTAANLMWECTRLLPDNDPLTAAALYWGGSWIKDTDDHFADKFYQALVKRCGKLPIGREADKLRWFPPKAPPSPDYEIVEPSSTSEDEE